MINQDTSRLLTQVRRMKTQAELACELGVGTARVRSWERGLTPVPSSLEDSLRRMLVRDGTSEGFTFIDLFAGIGGTRLGFESVGGRCVFTSEWNKFARQTYMDNFRDEGGHGFAGDITEVDEIGIPDHDVLLAGFPCQPFSIAGVSKKNSLGRPHGFQDETQGTLFFDVARIVATKRPRAFMLENVRNLVSHDKGRTFKVIRNVLTQDLGYHLFFQVMDASPFVPQGRKRIIIVGFNRDHFPSVPEFDFANIDQPGTKPTMRSILHPEDGSETAERHYTCGDRASVADLYTLTPRLWEYLRGYARKHQQAGNGFGFGLVGPDDVARTLSARYYKDGSEVLVSRGEGQIPRRLTPRECARLMGFPDDFRITASDTQAYKQFGNSVVVPLIAAVAELMVPCMGYDLKVPGIGVDLPVERDPLGSRLQSAVGA